MNAEGSLGDVITTTWPTADPLCATDLVTTRDYGTPTGQLYSETSAEGVYTTYQYDTRGRVKVVMHGTGPTDLRERAEYLYGDQIPSPTMNRKIRDRYLAWSGSAWVETKREEYQYDTFERLAEIDHSDGSKVVYTYDPMDASRRSAEFPG